jgi:hypothetical protein
MAAIGEGPAGRDRIDQQNGDDDCGERHARGHHGGVCVAAMHQDVHDRKQDGGDVTERASPGRPLPGEGQIDHGGQCDKGGHDQAAGNQPYRKSLPHHLGSSPIGEIGGKRRRKISDGKWRQYSVNRFGAGKMI